VTGSGRTDRAGVRVLVVNAGSSSLKLRVLDADDRLVADADLPAIRGAFDEQTAVEALRGLPEAEATGHRVVHGGERFTEATPITPEVIDALRDLTALAPLQQPAALRGIELVSRLRPRTPAVACFDTAFHSTLPAVARTYAVPEEWRRSFGLRRFGFHGLSHAWAARRARELVGDAARMLVSCHLGSGASLAAIADGVCVDTTMGFTPLEGLVMGTRSGSVDPGMLLWLQTEAGLDAADVLDTLEQRSGLLGLCGSADVREVLAMAAAGNERAVLARDVYVHHIAASSAAMAASLGGLSAIVFTGGVGENSAGVREAVCTRLRFLGVEIDQAANSAGTGDRQIGAPRSRTGVLVIAAREDRTIASDVRRLLDRG
jgi:acetate kinase